MCVCVSFERRQANRHSFHMEIDLSKHRQYRYQKTRLPKRKPNPGCLVWSVKCEKLWLQAHNRQTSQTENSLCTRRHTAGNEKGNRRRWNEAIFACKTHRDRDERQRKKREKNYSAVKLHNIQMTTTIFITVNKNPESSQRDNAIA